MNARHKAREIALQFLYRHDPISEQKTSDDEELAEELTAHFVHFHVPPESRQFAAELIAGTLREISTLDPLLEQQASNWKLNRMATVDRCILRMAVYEMKHFPETPASIIINEAVELAKEFGTAETPAFVNGILDAIKPKLRTVENEA
ncbi:MAG TPA: transcription antitermination factor NusB [Bdellovibrionales bacterium]|nr:MAG: transcription antitermination factor NusB [Bdellovibrionales bacterium GWB1_52_6]OFZ06046.1 MAG: transcription antitermination factor NusB [Bdellovibrionales bacterium GWA1_52_35]OFZ37072.1 MAG: transcription antitermination factor NusB [Bdellovibrionales bacterium GWC1_52_8]HAR44339.1 transcription antitermination factor NusB [Bdellovibrionales bacterium]HCM39329.1 transcription antitermination factor NusB [Bdellovibrionales bacterium]